MTTNTQELPPLPAPAFPLFREQGLGLFTAKQMQDYARASLPAPHTVVGGVTDERIIEIWDSWPKQGITSRRNAIEFYRLIEAEVLSRHPAVPALERPAAEAGWVSVEDRLPEPYSGEVLVWIHRGYCGFDEWRVDEWRDYGDDDITHWMRLPEPPRQEARTTQETTRPDDKTTNAAEQDHQHDHQQAFCDWRVALVFSSADPGKKIPWLVVGAEAISAAEKHPSFIRWLAAAFLPHLGVSLTQEQWTAGYAVACKFGVLEKRALDLTEEMFAALASQPAQPKGDEQ